MEPTTPAVETEVLATTVETPVETPVETTPPATVTDPKPTVEQLEAALAAEKAKTARAVAAEQTARAKRAELETELGTFRTQAEQREAERVANLSLAEKLVEETAKREAAELAALTVQSQWADFRIETELGAAGFLSGLEGEAKTSQLATLKALTSLEFVKDDGAFSITKFAEKFGGLKPKAPVLQEIETPAATPAPTVVDIGAPGTTPADAAPTQKAELQKLLQTAYERGDRLGYIQLQGQIAALK